MVKDSAESFGDLLSRFRKTKGLTQQQLANPDLNLSSSLIAMLESGERGKHKSLTRKQVWYLVTKMNLWPPDCDRLLEAAGHDTDRTEDEELDIQAKYDFQEIWIFARVILDPYQPWFDVVADKIIKKGVIYRYFTVDTSSFQNFLNRLRQKPGGSEDYLNQHLECNLLPEELFLTSFAIYNPGNKQNMYCCGTKAGYLKAERFYTMHVGEATRLNDILFRWRQRLNTGSLIPLKYCRRVYPEIKRSDFTSEDLEEQVL